MIETERRKEGNVSTRWRRVVRKKKSIIRLQTIDLDLSFLFAEAVERGESVSTRWVRDDAIA